MFFNASCGAQKSNTIGGLAAVLIKVFYGFMYLILAV